MHRFRVFVGKRCPSTAKRVHTADKGSADPIISLFSRPSRLIAILIGPCRQLSCTFFFYCFKYNRVAPLYPHYVVRPVRFNAGFRIVNKHPTNLERFKVYFECQCRTQFYKPVILFKLPCNIVCTLYSKVS